MSIFSPIFDDFITKVERINKDGYGTETSRDYVYLNVPCRYDGKVTLLYNELRSEVDYKATFLVPVNYYFIEEDVITYKEYTFIVKDIQAAKPVIGPAQYIQLRVISDV
jgi:hypothetical protein